MSPSVSARIKQDPGTGLYRIGFGTGEVLLKLYSYEAWYLKLRARLFPSRARREFRVLEGLAKREVPTLHPVCFGENDQGVFRRHSWIATVFLDNAETLEERLQHHPPRKDRTPILTAVAETVRKMHEVRFVHGGLFPRNLIFGPKPGTLPRVFDAPFGRFLERPLTRAERAADLACLLRCCDPLVSMAERARFFREYLGRKKGTGWGQEGRRLARATLSSSAFTRSVRRKLLFKLRGWWTGRWEG